MEVRTLMSRRLRPIGRAAVFAAVATLTVLGLFAAPASARPDGMRGLGRPQDSAPPPRSGYFSQVPNGKWSSLPSGDECAGRVHRSTWEPRPDNDKRNHVVVDPAAVHASFAARPRSVLKTYDTKWDTWLLPRVDGQFTGTTDEIFQWAACKWGLADNMLRAVAVRESTWYQFEAYDSNRCVTHYGCGDFFGGATPASHVYCNAIDTYGYEYQPDYGSGLCPKTFSIVGLMSWWDPNWGFDWADNQNGAFPFNRDSTAFAVDYLAGALRGCYEGWQWELGHSYQAGDIWGCVGAWYSGAWHDSGADGYIARVKDALDRRVWLDPAWPDTQPGCDPEYGCPGPDTLSGTDTTPPHTRLLRPADGSTRYFGLTYRPRASARDDSGIAKVVFYVDGVARQTDTTAPFYFTWRPMRLGWRTLRVDATDVYGNVARSAVVHVLVKAS